MTITNKEMNPKSRVFVAGHRGLVGSALVRALRASGYGNLLLRTRDLLDLRDHAAVNAFFAQERPEHVFLAAAVVGGIVANNNRPAEFILDNLAIQNNVLQAAFQYGVKRLLFLGSSCIYPRDCPQPIKEEYLLTGPLEPTNRPYAVAKIAGIETCWALNRQYGRQFIGAMPTNLYGPGDNYDPEVSHVIPGLIKKMHRAQENGIRSVELWGSGTPRREFLYSDDLAEACVYLMQLAEADFSRLLPRDGPPIVNIGCGEDLTIRELAKVVGEIVGYAGDFVFDRSKPDGTPRKLLDITRMRQLGWSPRTGFRIGLKLAYEDFLERYVHASIS